MKLETLKLRIEESIDDLGLLLDQIYKFSQKERESYFQRIQTMKNKLQVLKSSIRESNSSLIQKQYKQLYLAINTLKSQIQHRQPLLPSSKENREMTKCKDFKQMRKTHEETMKLLVDKDEEIKDLKSLLQEKEELIQINYEELRNVKNEFESVIEGKRLMQYEYNSYEIELESNKALVARYESDLMDMRIREEAKDKAFNNAIEELERLKLQLIDANQKILDLQYTAEVNIQKAIQAETSSKKAERTARDLNNNFSIKQNDNLTRLRQIGELQLSLKMKTDLLIEQQQKTRHLRQDIQVLQNQVHRLELSKGQIKEQFNKEKDILLYEKQLIQKQNSNGAYREEELKRQLGESQKKYMIVITKLNAAEEMRNTLADVQYKNSMLTEKVAILEQKIEKYQNQMGLLVKQKDRALIRLQNQQTAVRQSEVELFRFRQKLKIKEEEISQLFQSVDRFKGKIREYQKQLSSRDRKEKVIQTSLVSEKERIVKMEEKEKAKNQQIETLKIKLLRAKIQTIHQIRGTLSE